MQCGEFLYAPAEPRNEETSKFGGGCATGTVKRAYEAVVQTQENVRQHSATRNSKAAPETCQILLRANFKGAMDTTDSPKVLFGRQLLSMTPSLLLKGFGSL